MNYRHFAMILLAMNSTALLAQNSARLASADGSYWVEVEMTIFSSSYSGAERPVPAKNLRYLGSLHRLQQQSDSYFFPFGQENTLATSNSASLIANESQETDFIGPEYSPADPLGFKILDLERDPFLQLDRRFWRLNQANAKLQSTGEHTVLWHQVWRQPLKPRTQAASVMVQAGTQFGTHHQLEGSVRISGQGEAASIEALLWLSQFTQKRDEIKGDWTLPDTPVINSSLVSAIGDAKPAERNEEWHAHDVWVLNQSRDIGLTGLYYLDHPALGVLIELRPYVAPELPVPAVEPTPFETKKVFE